MNGLTSTPAQRRLARLSFSLAGLAIVILPVFAGLKSLAMGGTCCGSRSCRPRSGWSRA